MIIRILATKTSDRICAIMNLLQTIDIARHVGNENIETVIDKTKAPAFLPHWTILTAVWPFHSLFWIFFEKLEASLFRAGRHSNSTLYSQSLFLNEGEGRGGRGERGKIRKENIEYRIFDIHANKSNWYKYRLTYSSRYSWHFLYQVMFYGPFSAILHFLSHNRARIEYRWYVSRFSFRWVAAATNYTYPYFCLDISDNIEELQSRRYNDRWFLARCRVRKESTFPRVN